MTTSPSQPVPAIEVPGGARLIGFPQLEPPATNDSAAASLESQLAALLASMSCQLRILKLLEPLIDVVKELPNPSPQALQEFAKAANQIEPCFAMLTPAGVLPFLRGLLCLTIRSLQAFQQNLQNAATLAGTDTNPFSSQQVQSILDSYPPMVGILPLAAEFFAIAGLSAPQAPTLGSGTDAASLLADQSAVTAFIGALQADVDALGGCP